MAPWKRAPQEHFIAKVEKTDTCWLWRGKVGDRGYGHFTYRHEVTDRPTTVLAHRYAYKLWIGPIPEGMHLDHVRDRGCLHKHCVNPAHLEPVTPKENNARYYSRAETCGKGHPYTKENTYVPKPGQRECRECNRAKQRKYYRSKHPLPPS